MLAAFWLQSRRYVIRDLARLARKTRDGGLSPSTTASSSSLLSSLSRWSSVPISGTHFDTFSAFSICSLALAIRSSWYFFSLQLYI